MRAFAVQHLFRAFYQSVAALSGSNSAHKYSRIVIVKYVKPHQSICGVIAQPGKYRHGARIVLFGKFLHDFQFFGGSQSGIQLYPDFRSEFDNGVLGMVHTAYSGVAAPIVARGVRIFVYGRERQFVQISQNTHISVYVAACQRRSHGYAQHAAAPQRISARQRRDVAVVGHLYRATVFRRQVFIYRENLFGKDLFRHLSEQRRHPDFVVHDDARRRYSDSVDSAQFFQRLIDRIGNSVDMVLRIGIEFWVPYSLVFVYHNAVFKRGDLSVRTARVKAYPSSFAL